MPKNKDQGFTLIELIVVMLIFAVLAGIAIPLYTSHQLRAKQTAVTSDIMNWAKQVDTFVDGPLRKQRPEGYGATSDVDSQAVYLSEDGAVLCIEGIWHDDNPNTRYHVIAYRQDKATAQGHGVSGVATEGECSGQQYDAPVLPDEPISEPAPSETTPSTPGQVEEAPEPTPTATTDPTPTPTSTRKTQLKVQTLLRPASRHRHRP